MTAVLALVFLAVWRRWFESLVLAVSLVVEASAFIVVTTVVGRDRPDVPHLDNSPVGSSFPSGHTAAAAAYAAIAVIVFWHTRKVWARVLVSVVAIAIPIIVALARMYRGMHYLTDTVGRYRPRCSVGRAHRRRARPLSRGRPLCWTSIEPTGDADEAAACHRTRLDRGMRSSRYPRRRPCRS